MFKLIRKWFSDNNEHAQAHMELVEAKTQDMFRLSPEMEAKQKAAIEKMHKEWNRKPLIYGGCFKVHNRVLTPTNK